MFDKSEIDKFGFEQFLLPLDISEMKPKPKLRPSEKLAIALGQPSRRGQAENRFTRITTATAG